MISEASEEQRFPCHSSEELLVQENSPIGHLDRFLNHQLLIVKTDPAATSLLMMMRLPYSPLTLLWL